jgi:ATP-dependent Clp protease ATP-binding subunit ClpC
LDQLAEEGFDPEMGARPLRRVIQQKVEETLSDKVLAKEFKDGDTIWIDLDKDKNIVLKKKKPSKKAEPQPVAP